MSWSGETRLFDAVSEPPEQFDEASFFVFHDGRILLTGGGDGDWQPLGAEDWMAGEWDVESLHCIGLRDGQALFAADLRSVEDTRRFAGLRDILGVAESVQFALAGRASQIIDWHKSHRFCGRCGSATALAEAEHARVCDKCGLRFYPRIAPSIIVLVTRGEEFLLARNVRWPEGRYSTLAGFVEPGESIEETLHREVREEVGIEVGDLRYMGSQSWPFPNSLMIGFHAEYRAGDIVLQREEIADAAWFRADALPDIPGRNAISRWLIDAFIAAGEAR